MKTHLRNLALSTLAFALAPLAQANAVTIFDGATTAWTAESSLSTTAGGSSTFNLPPSNPPNSNAGMYGTDYFSLPGAITTGSGVWTFTTTATFSMPTDQNNNVGINVGFANNNVSTSKALVGGVNGGPVIADGRDFFSTNGSQFATLQPGTAGSFGFQLPLSQYPEGGNQTPPVTLSLVLNTNNPQWTLSELENGVLIDTWDYTTNPTITGIGVSANTSNTEATSVVFSGTTLTENVTAAVPEPSTWAMMAFGFAGLGFLAYRSKERKTGVNFRFA